MSKFSKRAKFLSILAAASAVGNAGARTGAITIPDYKYIPPSVEAQNAVKSEKNSGLNINRNNLQIIKGPRFSILNSIDAKSASVGGIVGSGLVGTAWLLTHLFLGKSGKQLDKYTKECLDYFIKALKKNKIDLIQFENKYDAFTIEFFSNKSSNSYDANGMIDALGELENVNKLEGKEAEDAQLRNKKKRNESFKKLCIGRYAFMKNIKDTLGDDLPAVIDYDIKGILVKGENGKILIDDMTLENFKKEYEKELEKAGDDEKFAINTRIRTMEKLANNELIKDVLTATAEKSEDETDDNKEKSESENENKNGNKNEEGES